MIDDPMYLPSVRVHNYHADPPSFRLTRKTMGLLLLLLVVAGLIGSFYLSQASHTAAAGLEIVRLTREKERLRQDNAELRKQIAELETLSSIRARATELGFVETESVEYLVVDIRAREPSSQEVSWPGYAEEIDQDEPKPLDSEAARWWAELGTLFESWTKTQR